MDQIISFFASFMTIYDLRGFNGPLRQALAILWVVSVLVTLAAPAAIPLYEREKLVHIRRVLYVSVPLLLLATLGLIFFNDSPRGRWGSDWLVDKDSAQLAVCKLESPGSTDTENVSYRARVHWLTPPTSKIASFHIGAINPNNELWPQVTSNQIAQGQDVQVDLVVSRRSMFPTRFTLVGLDRAAEEIRSNACRSGSTCYLQLPRDGVFRVSDEFTVNSFDEFVPRC
jgi:hypothetical protein